MYSFRADGIFLKKVAEKMLTFWKAPKSFIFIQFFGGFLEKMSFWPTFLISLDLIFVIVSAILWTLQLIGLIIFLLKTF